MLYLACLLLANVAVNSHWTLVWTIILFGVMFGYAECLRQKRFGFVNVQISTVERLEWEHIQRVLHEHQDNISATARALNMHRRTLQRKLAKPPLTGIQDEK